MENIKKLPKIIHQCMTIGMIPSSYKVSMSYEEQLLWFCSFLENEVIPVVNNNSEVVQELKTWFENLDVQEEIDNKLEEMAESGELTEIIAQYLDLQGILAYNTVSDLSNAENLNNGSFCKTYGKTTYNDGLGAFYKIRILINTDVIDGDNLVALTNYPTLVAEKMSDAIIGNLANLNTTNKTNIVNAINEVNGNVDTAKQMARIHTLLNKKTIVMGDSLCITGRWGTYFSTYSGADAEVYGNGSAGFCSKGVTSPFENMNFLEMLQTILSEKTTLEKNAIEYLILGGGINDALNNYTTSQIETAVTAFISYAKANLPKTKLILFPLHTFKWLTNVEMKRYQTILDTLVNNGVMTTGDFLFWTVDNRTYDSSDHVHLTDAGYQVLAHKILSFVLGSSNWQIENLDFTMAEDWTNVNLSMVKIGNVVHVHGQVRKASGLISSGEEICSIEKGAYITGSSTFNNFIPCLAYNSSTYNGITSVGINNGKLTAGRPYIASTWGSTTFYINGSFTIGVSGLD